MGDRMREQRALLNMKQTLQALKIEDEAIEDEAARYFAALDEAYDRIEFTPRCNGCGRVHPMLPMLPIARVRLGWRRRIALLGRRGLKAIGLARSR